MLVHWKSWGENIINRCWCEEKIWIFVIITLVLDCKQTVTKLKSPIVPSPRNCYRISLLFKNVIVIKSSFHRESGDCLQKKMTCSVTTVHLWTLTAAFCSSVWECRRLNHQGLNWCLSADSWQQMTSVSPSADELKLHGLKFSNALFHSFPETVCGCRSALRLRSLCGCLKHSSTQKTLKGPVCKIYDDIPWEMEYSIRSTSTNGDMPLSWMNSDFTHFLKWRHLLCKRTKQEKKKGSQLQRSLSVVFFPSVTCHRTYSSAQKEATARESCSERNWGTIDILLNLTHRSFKHTEDA